MKRQMKIAAVVSATALLAIGASFTSMAAAKTGTWAQEDAVWYCYDKNGDVYENEFCMSNGVELYVGVTPINPIQRHIDVNNTTYYHKIETLPEVGYDSYLNGLRIILPSAINDKYPFVLGAKIPMTSWFLVGVDKNGNRQLIFGKNRTNLSKDFNTELYLVGRKK